MIINIPIVFRRKVMKIKYQFLTLERPSMLMPTSSGRGEAMIVAPTIGKSQIN